MASSQKHNVNVVFGAMTIGKPGALRTSLQRQVMRSPCFQELSKHEFINTNIPPLSLTYSRNMVTMKSTPLVSTARARRKNISDNSTGRSRDTRFYPTVARNMPGDQWPHRLEHLRENLMRSLKALQAEKIHLWYLHQSDRTIPFEETLARRLTSYIERDTLHASG